MGFARQNGFPADVVGFAPVDGRICAWSDASGERSTPLRPAIRDCGTGADARLIGWRRWGGQTSEDEDQAQRTRHADTLCTFDVEPTQRLYFNLHARAKTCSEFSTTSWPRCAREISAGSARPPLGT